MTEQTNGYLARLLGKDESVLRVARQHWFVLAAEIASETVLTIALLVLISLIWSLWVPNPLIALAYLLLLLPLASLTRDVLTWSNRLYVVTTRRVIQLQGVLEKEVTDSSLEKVNDVKMKQSVWGRLLDYGDIEILTASELGVNKFGRLASPVAFKTAMLNAKAQMEYGNGDARPRPPAPAVAPAPTPAPALAAAPAPVDRGPAVVDLLKQLDTLRQHGVLTEAEFQNKKKELMDRL